jgi:hypothetical protein
MWEFIEDSNQQQQFAVGLKKKGSTCCRNVQVSSLLFSLLSWMEIFPKFLPSSLTQLTFSSPQLSLSLRREAGRDYSVREKKGQKKRRLIFNPFSHINYNINDQKKNPIFLNFLT